MASGTAAGRPASRWLRQKMQIDRSGFTGRSQLVWLRPVSLTTAPVKISTSEPTNKVSSVPGESTVRAVCGGASGRGRNTRVWGVQNTASPIPHTTSKCRPLAL
eukprot:7244409-Prymnesium_polylepis.1